LKVRAASFAAIAAVLIATIAFGARAAPPPPSGDTWPHPLQLSDASILVYQPQVKSWDDNRLSFRCAIGIKPTGVETETYGVIFATARTRVNKVSRTVKLEDLKITSAKFPTLPNNGKAYTREIEKQIAANADQISLDRLEASLAAGPTPCRRRVNDPPRSSSLFPAIHVSRSRPAVLQPVGDSEDFERSSTRGH
jgi:hypothetical protein